MDRVRHMSFDAVLFQSKDAWLEEQYRILSPVQQRLPRIYLEHDPPQEHPTNTRHWMDDDAVLLVHVTPFNALMWDSGRVPTCVIEHGVQLLQPALYTGERESGIVVVNNMESRGRRLGADVYAHVSSEVPLTLVGMGSEHLGGQGEIANHELPAFMAHHRYFFNPIRYTSLGLSIVEAMMVGIPVIGLATTELVTVIRDGDNGYIDTRVERLVEAMQYLRRDLPEARRLGQGARRVAMERFNIGRFASDWMRALKWVTS